MAATGNLAGRNKLGVREGEQEKQGGLGPVYKGKLEDGQVVAVRRLPASYYWESFRFQELKDDLLLAGKLKHDNIVQLLGVCLEQREKLLVYEYLPNASLDTILFDAERRRHLDWEKRYSHDSWDRSRSAVSPRGFRSRFQSQGHPQAKQSPVGHNDMNPKILDAGIVHPQYTEGHCMSWPLSICLYATPEWTVTGRTSRKSDMFSFGVILLEVVTGRGMYYDWRNGKPSKSGLNVWDKWNAGSIADIADASLGHRYSRNEMRNCVHIGLLCLQQDRKLRPDASAVMQALDTSCPTSLPTPSIPYRVQSIA